MVNSAKNLHIKIGNSLIGLDKPSYFIADIAANHDGSLNKAIELIYKAKESGANAAKFQHFEANTIVSDLGFNKIKNDNSHQSNWNQSVYKVYKKASINLNWTETLYKTCKKVGITFMTSPYSFSMIDHVNKYVPAFKIGSGDITWHEIIKYMSKKNKPILLATGASKLNEVKKAYNIIKKNNKNKIVLMQCNTNYTASLDNFKYINLNVLNNYKKIFKDVILGLSDHTPGHSTVLGSIALGARVIEKHFTLDNRLNGPDHKFAMNPVSWKEMIDRSRELELSMGSHIKKIEKNETQTVIIQRRSIRASTDLKKNNIITNKDLTYLRPAPKKSVEPYNYKKILGKRLKKNIKKGDVIKLMDII